LVFTKTIVVPRLNAIGLLSGLVSIWALNTPLKVATAVSP
jgi:hypothetical protein